MAISKLAIQPAQIFLSLALSLGAVQSAHSFEVSSGDQQACVNDAFRLCSAEIPDSERVAVCLDSNVENLSPACHAVIQQAMLQRTAPRNRRLHPRNLGRRMLHPHATYHHRRK